MGVINSPDNPCRASMVKAEILLLSNIVLPKSMGPNPPLREPSVKLPTSNNFGIFVILFCMGVINSPDNPCVPPVPVASIIGAEI